jgi:ZIP family zinc transporter
MIGAGSARATSLALVLPLGQVPADVPETFATIPTSRTRKSRVWRWLVLGASFAVAVLLAAGPLAVIAFEDVIIEAH